MIAGSALLRETVRTFFFNFDVRIFFFTFTFISVLLHLASFFISVPRIFSSLALELAGKIRS